MNKNLLGVDSETVVAACIGDGVLRHSHDFRNFPKDNNARHWRACISVVDAMSSAFLNLPFEKPLVPFGAHRMKVMRAWNSRAYKKNTTIVTMPTFCGG